MVLSFFPLPLLPQGPGYSLFGVTTLKQTIISAWRGCTFLFSAELDTAFIPVWAQSSSETTPPTLPNGRTNCHQLLHLKPQLAPPHGAAPLLPDPAHSTQPPGWPRPLPRRTSPRLRATPPAADRRSAGGGRAFPAVFSSSISQLNRHQRLRGPETLHVPRLGASSTPHHTDPYGMALKSFAVCFPTLSAWEEGTG